MRSRKHHKENEYLSHLQADPNNEIKSIIIKIRKFITKLGMLLNKTERNNIRKRLNQIDRQRRNRRQKRRLPDELTKIFNDLQFKKTHRNNAFDSSRYYGLKYLEYKFGDLDDYYKPVLAKESFDGNYQMCTCRGNKEKTMYITEYLQKVKPYFIALIDEKKTFSHKIQLAIANNLIHLTKSDRITL